jgi:hypothetical protein
MLKDLVRFSTGTNKDKCDYFINEYQFLSKELNSLRYNWDKFHFYRSTDLLKYRNPIIKMSYN